MQIQVRNAGATPPNNSCAATFQYPTICLCLIRNTAHPKDSTLDLDPSRSPRRAQGPTSPPLFGKITPAAVGGKAGIRLRKAEFGKPGGRRFSAPVEFSEGEQRFITILPRTLVCRPDVASLHKPYRYRAKYRFILPAVHFGATSNRMTPPASWLAVPLFSEITRANKADRAI
jgi:hypothetical protein